MLLNPKYQHKFMYVVGDCPGRQNLIVSEYSNKQARLFSCDLIRMVLNLAYFDEKTIKDGQISVMYLANKIKEKKRSSTFHQIMDRKGSSIKE